LTAGVHLSLWRGGTSEAILHINDHVLKLGWISAGARAVGSTYANNRRWIVRYRSTPEELEF